MLRHTPYLTHVSKKKVTPINITFQKAKITPKKPLNDFYYSKSRTQNVTPKTNRKNLEDINIGNNIKKNKKIEANKKPPLPTIPKTDLPDELSKTSTKGNIQKDHEETDANTGDAIPIDSLLENEDKPDELLNDETVLDEIIDEVLDVDAKLELASNHSNSMIENLNYPPELLESKQTGSICLSVSINHSGGIGSVALIRSSEFNDFDITAFSNTIDNWKLNSSLLLKESELILVTFDYRQTPSVQFQVGCPDTLEKLDN